MSADTLEFYVRHHAKVEKYNNERQPDGNPDEVTEVVVWTKSDGTPVYDDVKVAQLEADHQAKMEKEA